ncbi:hypothetical protein GUJ93_ZPchr0012g22191 [Zizania palustris]|uniref:Nudix hydrolase domain-containing protein n=1 Tax=Zizania palustris TaxID=103762 RepID=A0A8J5WTD4_ZIZPA|nr:hypothetical protein GUJ93_ZPchr0012g22191 [Zizania palustris]
MAAAATARSLSLSLPTRATRAPLLLRLLSLRRRHSAAGLAAPAPRCFRCCSASAPARRRGALHGPGGLGRRLGGELRCRRAMANSTNSTVIAESAMAASGVDVELLPFVNDKHGGVIVEMTTPMDSQLFSASLKVSLSKWREQGIRGVWIKLPIGLANLIQSAVEEGFWYHHAEETYLMLAYWLPATTHTLPVNATHRVGVGAFVMNDKREVLAVQEKSGVLRGLGVWKFPTGVVEPGEDINIGVVREVKEETGVDTEFVEVLAFRQSHKAFFDKSDLFFVCMLRPLSFDITRQESEIEAAQWMPVEELLHNHLSINMSS